MYYNKEELERIRKEGEQQAKQLELSKQNGRQYLSNGREITCVQCHHDTFQKSEALLNSRGLTFFDLDWLNESATTLMCEQCGFIHWYGITVTAKEG